jgi:regulator of sirC expression with transglutaminase-like and TPR domain
VDLKAAVRHGSDVPIEELFPAREKERLSRFREALTSSDLASALFALEGATPADEASAREQIEIWGGAVASRASAGGDRARAFAAVLAGAGLVGDTDDYYASVNSHLGSVVHRKRGLPILLSAVWILVGRAAGIEVEGVGFPGHFLARVGGPGGTLVDPFAGGRALTVADCKALLRRLAPDQPYSDDMLRAVTLVELLERVERNLAQSYAREEAFLPLYRSTFFWAATRPSSAEPLVQRARAAERLGARSEATEVYREILRRFPGTDEAKQADTLLGRVLSRGPSN